MSDVAINRTIRVGEEPQAARERYRAHFTSIFSVGGYVPTMSEQTVAFASRSFYTWQVVVAILGFPIGLVALLAEKKEYRVDAFFEPIGQGDTAIHLTGMIPSRAVSFLADRIDEFDPGMPAA